MKITRLNDRESEIEYIIHPDSGGTVPTWVMNHYMGINLSYVSEIKEYFQALLELEQWDAGDGKAVGETMMVKTKAEQQHEKGETKTGARMRTMFRKYKGLSKIGKKYECFEGMMAAVVENKLRPAKDVKAKLFNVSLKQGRVIGAGLAVSLASNLTAEAAVDEWVLKYPALQELDRAEVWFRPMTNTVANILLSEVAWGLKFRVSLGAFLSISDLLSDVIIVVKYFRTEGLEYYAWVLLGMIAASMFFQVLLVLTQHGKKKARLPKEILIVLSGLKPAFDARNVISGAAQEEHTSVDAKAELAFTRCAEMFAEAIPVSIRYRSSPSSSPRTR
jgi:hypothetical protein